MDFELLNVFAGFQVGAKLNGRGDATTKLEMICLQVRKLNFFKLSHSRKYLVTIPTEENSKEVGGLLPQKVFKTNFQVVLGLVSLMSSM